MHIQMHENTEAAKTVGIDRYVGDKQGSATVTRGGGLPIDWGECNTTLGRHYPPPSSRSALRTCRKAQYCPDRKSVTAFSGWIGLMYDAVDGIQRTVTNIGI